MGGLEIDTGSGKMKLYLTVVGLLAGACAADVPVPTDDALELSGPTCDPREAVRTAALGRLGLDPATCEPYDGHEVCGTGRQAGFELTYADEADGLGASVGVWRRHCAADWDGCGGYWMLVCSCQGCSGLLGFNRAAWPSPLNVDGKAGMPLFPVP